MSLMTADEVRRTSDPSLFGSAPFFTDGRVDTLLDLLGPLGAGGVSTVAPARVRFEWDRVRTADAAYEPRGPLTPVWNVADTYGNPDDSSATLELVEADFQAAADLAIRWRVLGDTAAADGCVRILTAWSTQVLPTSRANTTGPLVWCNRWPLMIQAAMLVSDYTGYTPVLDAALKDRTSVGRILSLAYSAQNNTAAWGVVYEIAAAVFLGERDQFDLAIGRWRTLFDRTVVDNIPVDEVRRQGAVQGDGRTGLWYSNFLLYAFTVAAEWARFNGEWLYDYTSPNGSTFRGFAEQVRFWTRYPVTFTFNTSGTPSTTTRSLPHDEILHALWPSPESQWILDQFPAGNVRDSIGGRGFVLAYRDRPLYG